MRRLPSLTFVVSSVAAAVLLATPAYAGGTDWTGTTAFSAQIVQDPPMIRSVWNGRCLDADTTSGGGNGTRVQLWDCNGQPQQRWSQGTEAVVRSYATGRCLDADLNSGGGANGTSMQLWDCNFNNQQKFYYHGGTFLNSLDGRCLDADTTQDYNGGKVQLWDCNGSVQQQWEIVP